MVVGERCREGVLTYKPHLCWEPLFSASKSLNLESHKVCHSVCPQHAGWSSLDVNCCCGPRRNRFAQSQGLYHHVKKCFYHHACTILFGCPCLFIGFCYQNSMPSHAHPSSKERKGSNALPLAAICVHLHRGPHHSLSHERLGLSPPCNRWLPCRPSRR